MKENNVVKNSISETIKQKLLNNDDVMVRDFKVLNHTITIIYLKSMCDKNLLSRTIIEPILHIKNESDCHQQRPKFKLYRRPQPRVKGRGSAYRSARGGAQPRGFAAKGRELSPAPGLSRMARAGSGGRYQGSGGWRRKMAGGR